MIGWYPMTSLGHGQVDADPEKTVKCVMVAEESGWKAGQVLGPRLRAVSSGVCMANDSWILIIT